MSGIGSAGFGGMVPRLGPRSLGERDAQTAVNVDVKSTELRSLFAPKQVSAAPNAGGTINTIFLASHAGSEKWLVWDTDVDVRRAPIFDDTLGRVYWTGQGEPRMSVFSLLPSEAKPGPANCFVLGVFAPVTAPTVGHTGGATSNVSRSYRYCFVTQYGERSALSPPSAIHAAPGDATWNLSGIDPAPLNTYSITSVSWAAGVATFNCTSVFGLRAGEMVTTSLLAPAALNATFTVATVGASNFTVAMDDPGTITDGVGQATRDAPHNVTGMKVQFYRSTAGGTFNLVTDAAGVALEINAGTTTFNDPSSSLAVDPAPSVTYAMPPVGMGGLISLPNGIMVGFVGKDVYFSAANKPWAYPPEYVQTVDFDVVGLGYFGNVLVIPTTGMPFEIIGITPETMGGGADKKEVAWPCLSKRGIVSGALGVFYPTTDGIVVRGASGFDLVSRDLYTRKEWEPLSPESIIATSVNTEYVVGYTPEDGDVGRVLVMDRAELAILVAYNIQPTALWADPTSGKLYYAAQGSIWEWEGEKGARLIGEWVSREYVSAPPINMGAVKVNADFGMDADEAAQVQSLVAAVVAANQALIDALNTGGGIGNGTVGEQAIAGDDLQEVPDLTWDSLTFQLISNGEVVFSAPVTDDKAFRLPGGYTSDRTAYRLSGNVKRVYGVTIAESMRGLRRV